MDYAAALIEQNRLLGELVRDAEPSSPVPTCPGWTLRQLIRHVGRGHRWAAQMVTDRMDSVLDPRSVRDGKPPADPQGELEWLHASARAVVEAVESAPAGTQVWTFIGPRPAHWWVRRRLHEETVHRADAALALGVRYELAPALAADGISESLDLLAAQPPGDRPAPLDDGGSLHLHATDDGLGAAGEWMIYGSDGRVSWEHGHAKGAAAARGRAEDLLVALMRRRAAGDVGVEIVGDQSVWTTWLDRTQF